MTDGSFTNEYAYKVLEVKKKKLVLSLISETRKSRDGKLVWWELILMGNDTYVWKRNDWKIANTAHPIKRIK